MPQIRGPITAHLRSVRARRVLRASAQPALTVLVAAAVLIVVRSSAWVAESSSTLVEMGFDPDRARLIASLVVTAVIAGAGTLVSGQRVVSILLGSGTFAMLFGRVFVQETQDAVAVSGARIQFDPVGWGLTVVALVAAAVAVAWSASTLAISLRRGLVLGVDALAASIHDRRPRAALVRPGVGLLALVVILGASPVLADMLNFGPDARMRHGGPAGIGLFGGGGTVDSLPVTSGDPAPGALAAPARGSAPAVPSTFGPPPQAGTDGSSSSQMDGPGSSPLPGSSAIPGSSSGSSTSSDARPWLAWRPTGSGTVSTMQFPAPWTGGSVDAVTVSIYLPPGYSTSARSYPVVYEVPWSLSYWDGAVQLPPLLDGLINSGQIPPEIVVFVSAHGGPYPDSECVNSFDGREHFDSFLTETVVPWIDGNLRTITQPAARTLFGFSAGGFCSPNLLFKHPDLFRQAIAISGYYTAGVRSSQTINAWRPFADDPGLLAANSPVQTCALLPTDTRRALFVAVAGDPSEPFYGPQMRAFGAALTTAGIPFVWLPAPLGHRWSAVRQQLPLALVAVAAHEVASGVFG